MHDLVVLWRAEHVNFARLLDILERQLAVFHAGEQPSYDLMRDVVYYLLHYPEQIHHPQEEVAFARLLERDPALKPDIDRLRQEHRVIGTAGEALLKQLSEVEAGALQPRSIVEAAVATYVSYYRQHLASEEEAVIPRAAQFLTPQDWAAVTSAVPAGPDPLSGGDIEEHYRNLRRHIALESQAG